YETLNSLLKRMVKNEHELFRVLDRPEIPLHNNLSERDIRDYVKKRKISGSTRSDAGKKCRDTFASLKKTCRKQGISFWNYLIDRTSGSNMIPPMAEILQAAAC
ncbi:MAG: transposase, partial [Methylococcales bacterium]